MISRSMKLTFNPLTAFGSVTSYFGIKGCGVFLENNKMDLRLFSGFRRFRRKLITTYIEKYCTQPLKTEKVAL